MSRLDILSDCYPATYSNYAQNDHHECGNREWRKKTVFEIHPLINEWGAFPALIIFWFRGHMIILAARLRSGSGSSRHNFRLLRMVPLAHTS